MYRYQVVSIRNKDVHCVYDNPVDAVIYALGKWDYEAIVKNHGKEWVAKHFEHNPTFSSTRFMVNQVAADQVELLSPTDMSMSLSTDVPEALAPDMGVTDLWQEDAADAKLDKAVGRGEPSEIFPKGVVCEDGYIYVVRKKATAEGELSLILGGYADPTVAFDHALSQKEKETAANTIDFLTYFYAHTEYVGETHTVTKVVKSAPIDVSDKPRLFFRHEVKHFGIAMEDKLREHDDRPGWRDATFTYLWKRFYEELGEVKVAFDAYAKFEREGGDFSDKERIVREVQGEIADVANFLMMIHDNLDRTLLVENLDRMMRGIKDRHDHTVEDLRNLHEAQVAAHEAAGNA